jgi:hypothetical protein
MNRKWRAQSKNDLIVEVWEQLDCESVGTAELEQIQEAIRDALGAGAVDSPASIARLLADEGAVLRHPEVLDFDTEWRQQTELASYREMDFASLSGAALAIERLDALQRQFEQHGDELELFRLRQFVNDVRDDLMLLGNSKTATELARAEAREITQWLSVWRHSPDLFADWLALRLISKEFVELFPDFRPSN